MLGDHLAGEVEGDASATWLTLISAPMPQTAWPSSSTAGAGAADAAALDAAGADQAALGELADQARDRGAGQPELGGQPGPRPRAVVAQPAQHEREVGPAQRQLVGRTGGRSGASRKSDIAASSAVWAP